MTLKDLLALAARNTVPKTHTYFIMRTIIGNVINNINLYLAAIPGTLCRSDTVLN